MLPCEDTRGHSPLNGSRAHPATRVSLILNERPGSRLSQEAVERVRTAAAELGYRPNPAAQSLRSGKTRSIGFISDQVTVTRYASGMIRGVLAAAQQHDHTVLIAETGDDSGHLPELLDAMIDRRVDGLIIGLMVARMIDLPNPTQGIPLVIVNGSTPTDLPNVLPDEYSAGPLTLTVASCHCRRAVTQSRVQDGAGPPRSRPDGQHMPALKGSVADVEPASCGNVGGKNPTDRTRTSTLEAARLRGVCLADPREINEAAANATELTGLREEFKSLRLRQLLATKIRVIPRHTRPPSPSTVVSCAPPPGGTRPGSSER